MFVLYALLGVAGCLLYARIPRRPPRASAEPAGALGPSRHIVYRLAALFSLDAFAGGFVVQSLLALWLFERFDLSLSAASLFFFWSGVLSAFSFPVAAWLSRRIGLINTMVFTHIPSSLCLILAAFAPTLALALALLLVRAALSQMDVPTRSSYVMAVVTEAERPAAASFTSVPRSLAAAASPAIAGALFAASFQVLAAPDLRHPQDRLRPAAPHSVPAREAPGRTMKRSHSRSTLSRPSIEQWERVGLGFAAGPRRRPPVLGQAPDVSCLRRVG